MHFMKISISEDTSEAKFYQVTCAWILMHHPLHDLKNKQKCFKL